MQAGLRALLFSLYIGMPTNANAGDRLVFYVVVDLYQVVNEQNGQCASQIIDIPLPAGFRLKDRDVGPAQAAVKPYQDRLVATCSRHYIVGRQAPAVVWNVRYSVEDIERFHERMRQNRQPVVDI
jgi:hypothetical protein